MSFERAISLTVARPQSLFIQAPNAIIIKDLRVQFKIEKKIGKEPNTCDITVTNLAEDTRGQFEIKPLHIRLDAGYSDNIERIFAGDLIAGNSVKNGADWETTLQLSDGARAYAHARVNRSFKSGTTLRQAIGDVAKVLGLKAPSMTHPAFGRKFASGVTLFGLANREMTRLLKPFDFIWSIQDGRLQILHKDEARKEQAIVIAQDTGMIGSPEFGVPEKKGKPPILTVMSTLKPAATPGGLIQVESKKHNGLFRMNRVLHDGDTHGQAWTTTMEAVQL